MLYIWRKRYVSKKIISVPISIQLALVTLAIPAISYEIDLAEENHDVMTSEHFGNDYADRQK